MDVRQFRHFVAVAETLHFGHAAERLGMTQPPLSQSILALEREIGAPLFLRTRRHVALSPLGEQWLGAVRSALAGVDALPALVRQLAEGKAGRLELSFVSTADYNILPTLVQRYAAHFPDVEIALTEATSDIQINALQAGRGHAGIVIPPAEGALPAGLAYRRLMREPLVAALPESWLDSGRLALDPATGSLSAAAAIAAPLIIFPRHIAPAFHDLVTGYHARHGGTPVIAQQAIQMQTIISLVSAGMGIALVPASLQNLARTGVRYAPLAGDAPRLETGIIWREGDTTPTLLRLLDTVTQLGDGAEAQGPCALGG